MDKKPVKNAGFTIPELMMAIAIFVIGFAMITGLFPAGMVNYNNANKHSAGVMVCNNGLAKVKAKVTHDPDAPHTPFAKTTAEMPTYAPACWRELSDGIDSDYTSSGYLFATTSNDVYCLIVGRAVNFNSQGTADTSDDVITNNLYEVMAIACEKRDPGSTLEFHPEAPTSNGTKTIDSEGIEKYLYEDFPDNVVKEKQSDGSYLDTMPVIHAKVITTPLPLKSN